MDNIQGKKNTKRNAIKKRKNSNNFLLPIRNCLLEEILEGLSLLDPLVLVEINLG